MRSNTLWAISVCFACVVACRHAGSPATSDAAVHLLPPPTRPSNVFAEVHLGQPRATADSAGQIMGTHLPLELGLAVGLGVDSTVLSAVDTSRPIDAVFVGTGSRPEMLVVLTPSDESQMRTVLQTRYRFVPVEGLGDQLEQISGRSQALRCALVAVPGLPSSRVVCASRAGALEHAGRYAAYESAAHANDHNDLVLDADGSAARTALLPIVQQMLDSAGRSLQASASDPQAIHTPTPSYGDPHALAALVSAFSQAVASASAELRHFTLRGSVRGSDMMMESDIDLDAAGHSAVTRDALSRIGIPTTHALASLLPPDAAIALASHAVGPDRGQMIDAALDEVLTVFGSRVSDMATARTDLRAMFAQVGDEAAAAITRTGTEAPELMLLFSQRDGGALARAEIEQLSHATWLRAWHVGDAGVEGAHWPRARSWSNRAVRRQPIVQGQTPGHAVAAGEPRRRGHWRDPSARRQSTSARVGSGDCFACGRAAPGGARPRDRRLADCRRGSRGGAGARPTANARSSVLRTAPRAVGTP